MSDVTDSVHAFYSDQSILVTGATGFLGKTITEKLLRTCPKIKRIFLLIRNKKGKDSKQRLVDLFDDVVFSRMKEENPSYLEKVTLIPGDIELPGNGISESDRTMLIQEVTVVFHGAATVRFDEHLKTAVRINIYGTKQLLQLCSKCWYLKAFVHISTAFSNCVKSDVLKEEVYAPPMHADDVIRAVESIPSELLEVFLPLIICGWPNTYSFSKQIAEDLVRSEAAKKKIPAAIFRPAIVIGAVSEPIPGWIDNIYGPTGVTVAVGAGVMRTMPTNRNSRAELVPVDRTVNATLAVAWESAELHRNISKDNYFGQDTVPVYNYTISKKNPLTWGEYCKYSLQSGYKCPSVKSVWCYSMTLTSNITLYHFLSFFLHILPAILVDSYLSILGKKPQALQIYRKIHKFLMAVAYFSNKQWDIQNENTVKLWNKLSEKDKKLFNFDLDHVDWNQYFDDHIKSMRIFILKETLDTLPEARKKSFRFCVLHRLIQIIFISVVAWLSWTLINRLLSKIHVT